MLRMSEIMNAKFEIAIPEGLWIAALSLRYPAVTFEILSILPTADMVGNALIKIVGPDLDGIIAKIKSHPSFIELHLLSETPNSLIVNVKTRDPLLLVSLIKSEVILKMPVVVQNGVAVWDVLAPHEKIRTLNELLLQKGVQINLKSIRQYKEKPQFTARQTEVLDYAVKLGYYEIPRKITLTELADRIGVAKSTLSGILRRIDKKLIQVET